MSDKNECIKETNLKEREKIEMFLLEKRRYERKNRTKKKNEEKKK